MKTEKTLKVSSYFLKFLMTMQVVICLGLAFVYFHSMVSSEKYTSLIITEERGLSFRFDVKEIPTTYSQWKETKQYMHYNLLDGYSKFYVIWSLIINFIGCFFILYLFNVFLKNTKNLQLFFNSNIKILQKIIVITTGLFVFNFLLSTVMLKRISMVFYETDIPHHIVKEKVSFEFLFCYPLAIIFFFVLREVFKRGQELKQENDLTI
ncbi:DUF2975 domain-containing protein [Tenacibaculum insulae]|uniref:DUF2975 domain-containing protein n=1 Tax=Tenacibaculum insulae TaxID=2029677 RepID=UPI003AB5FE35